MSGVTKQTLRPNDPSPIVEGEPLKKIVLIKDGRAVISCRNPHHPEGPALLERPVGSGIVLGAELLTSSTSIARYTLKVRVGDGPCSIWLFGPTDFKIFLKEYGGHAAGQQTVMSQIIPLLNQEFLWAFESARALGAMVVDPETLRQRQALKHREFTLQSVIEQVRALALTPAQYRKRENFSYQRRYPANGSRDEALKSGSRRKIVGTLEDLLAVVEYVLGKVLPSKDEHPVLRDIAGILSKLVPPASPPDSSDQRGKNAQRTSGVRPIQSRNPLDDDPKEKDLRLRDTIPEPIEQDADAHLPGTGTSNRP